MPADQPFRPARVTPKPQIQGPQTAIVVGPSGEEIHTDKYARVKAQFHWDRYGNGDENASCWIRVAQGSAGKGWGNLTLPRIGHEVIVEFLEGDPDRPIITGQVYNADAMPPYTLPGEATKTTIKTNSSKGGGGFNELRFEDKKDSEQIFLHAARDLESRIENDAKEWVGNEQHLIVKKDQFETVEGNSNRTVKGNTLSKVEGDLGETINGAHHFQVDGAEHLTVKGDHFVAVDGDENQKFAKNVNLEAAQKISIKATGDYHAKTMNFAIDAGGTVHIKGASSVVIEGSSQVSLKAGGSFVDVSAGGVTLTGPSVKINSGGAAGSGSGSSPTAPAAAEPPDPPEPPVEAATAEAGQAIELSPAPATPASYSPASVVLQQAAQDGTPFCEECARAAEEEAAEQTTSWIEVELVGDDDKPVSGERYTVTLPDGTVEEGTLDDHGIARIEQFEPGNCKISFPDLDEEAWEEA
jgi:type VI secretion system secreted protein VgrG